MKEIMNIILAAVVSIAFISGTKAQDPQFSQYRMTPLLMNPGYTGLNYDLRAVVNYREQWKSVATPFSTAAFSFDMNATRDKQKRASLGIGLQFLTDRAGDARMGMTQGNLLLSGILELAEDSKLSVGLMGGFGQRSVDYSALRWESQYVNGSYLSSASSGENLASNNFTYMDAGAGFVWSYGKDAGYITQNNGFKMNFGASFFHFGIPNASYFSVGSQKLDTKFTVHASAEIGKENTNLTFIPELAFIQQGPQRQILVGNVFRYLLSEGSHVTGFVKSSALSLGLNYRVQDALITSVMVDYANFSVGFSYDITMSKLAAANNSRGGFEVALRFVTPNPFAKVYRSRI
ncbi:MAG: PorP/SprF family type IX secretion system membrane protein [Flavobacteriales bacterium]